jgi:hypothetical protein
MNIASIFRSWTSSGSGSSEEKSTDYTNSKDSEKDKTTSSRSRPTLFSSNHHLETPFHPIQSADSNSDIKLVIQQNRSFELSAVELDKKSREMYSPPLFLPRYKSKISGGLGEDHFGCTIRGYPGQHAF